MKQPEQVYEISCRPEYVDKWTIVLDFGDDKIETLYCSDNPNHPQGVFSSNDGNLMEEYEVSIDWKELPLSLQTFIQNYIVENK
jgi:hypothetical protein